MAKGLILIIDESAETREMYADCFRYHDYDVIEAADGIEGAQLFQQQRPDLIVTELSGDPQWMRALRTIRWPTSGGRTAMIACSTWIDRAWPSAPAGIEVDVVLPKPTLPNELLAEAESLLARQAYEQLRVPA